MDPADDKVMQELRDVVAAAEEALRDARAQLGAAGENIEDQVRKHPFVALGIAAGIGLIVGLLLARK
jgi:ElaB/YqjD/DUF883 family membrane-anchored ribosome-binding protein